MAKEPDHRYATAIELSAAAREATSLRAASTGREPTTPAHFAPAAKPSYDRGISAGSHHPVVPTRPWWKRRLAAVLAVVVTIVSFAAVAATLMLANRSGGINGDQPGLKAPAPSRSITETSVVATDVVKPVRATVFCPDGLADAPRRRDWPSTATPTPCGRPTRTPNRCRSRTSRAVWA